jgi:hypothetical protein
MINLSREIKRTDVENRRNIIWANIAAFGVVAVMVAFLLLSNGGAPQPDGQRITAHPPLNSQMRPNG